MVPVKRTTTLKFQVPADRDKIDRPTCLKTSAILIHLRLLVTNNNERGSHPESPMSILLNTIDAQIAKREIEIKFQTLEKSQLNEPFDKL